MVHFNSLSEIWVNSLKFVGWNEAEVHVGASVTAGRCIVLSCLPPFTGLLYRHQGSNRGRQRQTGHPYLNCRINDFPSATAQHPLFSLFLPASPHSLPLSALSCLLPVCIWLRLSILCPLPSLLSFFFCPTLPPTSSPWYNRIIKNMAARACLCVWGWSVRRRVGGWWWEKRTACTMTLLANCCLVYCKNVLVVTLEQLRAPDHNVA